MTETDMEMVTEIGRETETETETDREQAKAIYKPAAEKNSVVDVAKHSRLIYRVCLSR